MQYRAGILRHRQNVIGQVHVIAADADPLAKHLERGAIGPGLHVVETNVLVDIVAHRLHEWPAGRQMPEQRPSRVAEFAIDLAIAAGEQKQQHVARQVLHAVLQRIPNLDVGQPVVLDQGIGAKHDATGWNDGPATEIAIRVGVLANIDLRLHRQSFEPADRWSP